MHEAYLMMFLAVVMLTLPLLRLVSVLEESLLSRDGFAVTIQCGNQGFSSFLFT